MIRKGHGKGKIISWRAILRSSVRSEPMIADQHTTTVTFSGRVTRAVGCNLYYLHLEGKQARFDGEGSIDFYDADSDTYTATLTKGTCTAK